MIKELIVEETNIYSMPSIDYPHSADKGREIIIGDLHANAIKLLFILIKHNIAKNCHQEDYASIVALYQKPTQLLTKNDLRHFNDILAKVQFVSEGTLQFLGDELADRGKNDYFTLKILAKMHENRVPFKIVISNHSMEFVQAYEMQDHFHAPMLSLSGHAPSLENLQILVENGIVSRQEILDIANRFYKPHLQLLTYILNKKEAEILILSHAGIGLNTIKQLAYLLKVSYEDRRACDLADTIENINAVFKHYVQNNTLHLLFDRRKMRRGYEGQILNESPLEFLLWNRYYQDIERPCAQYGYSLFFVHGHDSGESTGKNICNLDNMLGKAEHLNRGTYTAIFVRDK